MKSLLTYINESFINEEVGSVNDVLLYWENDEPLYRQAETLVKSMLKKEKRGTELSKEVLSKSSAMDKIVSDTIKKYSKEITKLTPTTSFRKELRKELVDSIFYMLDDFRNYDKD